MKNRKFNLLLALCILLSIGFIGTAYAYLTNESDPITNTFVASGGGKIFDFDNQDENKKGVFTLKESKATRSNTGVYTLGSEQVSNNDYIVMPGINIPKDPKITIKNKSEVPTYLYLEVVGDVTGFFTYSLDTKWVATTATGAHGGTVYIYKGTDDYILGKIDDETIDIIEGDMLYTLDPLGSTKDANLKFYAYIAQTGIGDIVTTYNTCFPKGRTQ